MLIEVNSSDIMTLADFILDTVTNIYYQGTDADDYRVYQIDCRPDVSYEKAKYEAGEIIERLIDQVKNAQKQPETPKQPEPDYKTEVFDLISSRPIPGVESIEVNESQRKFVVKYKYDDTPEPITNDSKTTYTLDQLEALWKAYQWQLVHDLPDFRIESFIKFIKIPMEIYCHSNGDIERIKYKE